MREPSAGTTPVPENTRTRLGIEISSSAALVAFVSPGQLGRTAANTYDFASVPPVAGDDPVNNDDPSGDYCSVSNPVAIMPVTPFCPPKTEGPNGKWTVINPNTPWSANDPNDQLLVYTPFYNDVQNLSSGGSLDKALSTLWDGIYQENQDLGSGGMRLLTLLGAQAQNAEPSNPDLCSTGNYRSEFQCDVGAILTTSDAAGTGVPGLEVYEQFLVGDSEQSLAYLVYSFNTRLTEIVGFGLYIVNEFYGHEAHTPPGLKSCVSGSGTSGPVV